ncbi:hypothetical protein CN532_13555 [Bacillus wiedmannii]|nr:hypothetical protein CN532_13555 [Bacillus wiedmannii]
MRVEFTDLDYKRVEAVLLNDVQLNHLQRTFIELFENKTIIAGPGTGKTTSLAAKITLMLLALKRENTNEGICIITHTNVAVNEINNALQKAGVGKIKHPHFIGTIHEFFNKFCLFPFFRMNFKHNSINFSNGHNDIEYYVSMLSKKYSWMSSDVKTAIARRIEKSHLIIDYDQKIVDIENSTDWDKFDKYKLDMLGIKMKRKSLGFLTYDDTFFFSDIFLFNDKIVEILRNRFKYIFIDEFQDTHKDGERLLDQLFNTDNNIIQKIGDPYQTITYGETMPVVKEEDTFKLNVSNRFGEELAKHLNIIIPEACIETHEENTSFKPILLAYNNPKSVGVAYENIIKELSKQSDVFNKCEKKDSILVLRKDSTNEFFNTQYKEDKKKKRDSVVRELKNVIVNFIHNKITELESGNSGEIKRWILKHEKIYKINEILSDMIKVGVNETLVVNLKQKINSILRDKEINGIRVDNKLFDEVSAIIIKNLEVDDQSSYENQIATIHSVKGETHRSVLLLDFEERQLTKILMHRYLSSEPDVMDFINRNLLYVAMSRASHLFVFAIKEEDLTEDVKQKFGSTDWDIRYVQEFV